MASFKKEISIRREEMREHICNGGLTLEDYKAMCGLLKGLDLALELYEVEQEEGENQ